MWSPLARIQNNKTTLQTSLNFLPFFIFLINFSHSLSFLFLVNILTFSPSLSLSWFLRLSLHIYNHNFKFPLPWSTFSSFSRVSIRFDLPPLQNTSLCGWLCSISKSTLHYNSLRWNHYLRSFSSNEWAMNWKGTQKWRLDWMVFRRWGMVRFRCRLWLKELDLMAVLSWFVPALSCGPLYFNFLL